MTTVLFDSTRLFMRASLAAPTGIDRVTEAYGRWLLSRDDVELVPVCTLGGLATPLSLRSFVRVLSQRQVVEPTADWLKLTTALRGPPDETSALRAGAEHASPSGKGARYAAFAVRVLGDWRPRRFSGPMTYVNVSHFGLEQPDLLERLTRRGATPVAMVHDLIPIAYPEYCSAPASGWHRRRIDTLLRHGALVIANSQATADELVGYAEATDQTVPQICVAPLGQEPAFSAPVERLAGAHPYFVCVGTLEPRKNVAFLLTLWRRLAETMGDRTPRLVLAGQRGWENEAIIDHLERSPPIRRFVHEIRGLTDGQLASLIGGAQALLAPSFSEGFDLPVAEAAALGTPVIASDIPVHRELARGVQLLDPTDGPAWMRALEAATHSRASIPRAAPFTWRDHFDIVGEAMGLACP